MRGVPVLAFLGVALLAAVPSAPSVAAHPESDAPALDPRVLEAGHVPAVVQPHTQWLGGLTLRPGADVLTASYQVCRVGLACFAPPATATRTADGFAFDTRDYTVAGPDGAHPVDYQAGWRIGVKWFLGDASGNVTELPPAAHCGADSGADCLESDYLAFDIAAAHGTPSVGLASTILLVALAALARRRHG